MLYSSTNHISYLCIVTRFLLNIVFILIVSTIITIIFTYICNTTVIIVIIINVTINTICSSLFKRS